MTYCEWYKIYGTQVEKHYEQYMQCLCNITREKFCKNAYAQHREKVKVLGVGR